MTVRDLIQSPISLIGDIQRRPVTNGLIINGKKIKVKKMKLKDLNENLLSEAIKQYDIDETIAGLRNNYMFYAERGLRGSSVFESGKCYEFALALYNYLKSQGEQPELVFLVGNMKKSDAEWYDSSDFDPTTEHPFHTIVQVRKFYYDINGKLGTKREIKAMWSKFRRKQLIPTTPTRVKKYVKDNGLVKDLEEMFKIHYEGILDWR